MLQFACPSSIPFAFVSGHSNPPWSPVTSIARVCVILPPPHVFEHVFSPVDQALITQSTAQGWSLQVSSCLSAPSHLRPPYAAEVSMNR
jgi:hypothetical protein